MIKNRWKRGEKSLSVYSAREKVREDQVKALQREQNLFCVCCRVKYNQQQVETPPTDRADNAFLKGVRTWDRYGLISTKKALNTIDTLNVFFFVVVVQLHGNFDGKCPGKCRQSLLKLNTEKQKLDITSTILEGYLRAQVPFHYTSLHVCVQVVLPNPYPVGNLGKNMQYTKQDERHSEEGRRKWTMLSVSLGQFLNGQALYLLH